MATRFCGLGFLALGVLVCLGCGGPAEEPTYQVTGTVTMNGSPIEGAVVSFSPASGGAAATGVTDASGKYSLSTRSQGDGAVAGKYKVTIAKYDRPPEEMETQAVASDADVTADDYEEPWEEEDDLKEAADPAKNLLPPQYANRETSGFEADVVEGDNVHDFELEGQNSCG